MVFGRAMAMAKEESTVANGFLGCWDVRGVRVLGEAKYGDWDWS